MGGTCGGGVRALPLPPPPLRLSSDVTCAPRRAGDVEAPVPTSSPATLTAQRELPASGAEDAALSGGELLVLKRRAMLACTPPSEVLVGVWRTPTPPGVPIMPTPGLPVRMLPSDDWVAGEGGGGGATANPAPRATLSSVPAGRLPPPTVTSKAEAELERRAAGAPAMPACDADMACDARAVWLLRGARNPVAHARVRQR